MKAILIVLMVFGANISEARNLSAPDAPSELFRKDAEARKAFIQNVLRDEGLSEKVKEAYIALVEPETAEISGDTVLERLDPKVVAWFYGASPEETEKTSEFRHSNPLVQDAARLSRNPMSLAECRSYRLCVWVSIGKQEMSVYYNGRGLADLYRVPVSTASPGRVTPTGTFTVEELAGPQRVSGRYNGAALYYAMQISGHIFIHATAELFYPDLGRRASAGCIRTTFAVAERLNHLMRDVGGWNPNNWGSGHVGTSRDIRVVVTPH